MNLLQFLQPFFVAFKNQLISDEKRWGNTWLKRPRKGQEKRIENDIADYYDRYYAVGTPVPWLKIIGNCYIAWVRENNPEIFPE